MPKKQNLLIINQFASLPQYSFGAGERFYFLSEFLHKMGYDVNVVSGAFSHLFKYYPNVTGLFTTEQTPYAEFTWVKLHKYKPEDYLWRTLCLFEFAIKLFWLPVKKRKPDVVLVSSMSLLPILYATWLKWRYKTRFVLEIRDIWPMTPVEIGGYSKKHPLILFLGFVERLGYKKADHVVSVLPGFKKHLEESGFPDKPFTWIPNGIGKADDSAPEKTERLLPENKFNIIYAGTIGNANAMEYFIEAADILKDHESVHLTIIGDGPLKANLENESAHLTNVTFLPKVLKKDLSAIIDQADVCYIGWHGKRIYNYGVSANKYNDYMLQKKAILSSSNISNDPVLIAKCGLNVPAADAKAIADGILELQNMPADKLLEMGMNGYRFLQENQVYDVLANKYSVVLESLFK